MSSITSYGLISDATIQCGTTFGYPLSVYQIALFRCPPWSQSHPQCWFFWQHVGNGGMWLHLASLPLGAKYPGPHLPSSRAAPGAWPKHRSQVAKMENAENKNTCAFFMFSVASRTVSQKRSPPTVSPSVNECFAYQRKDVDD